jgi:hypothetical protein
MLPFIEKAEKFKVLDEKAIAEGRKVDEIPAHALLKKADSKKSDKSSTGIKPSVS